MDPLGNLARTEAGHHAKTPQIGPSPHRCEKVGRPHVQDGGDTMQNFRPGSGSAALPPGDPLSPGHTDEPCQLVLGES